MKRIKEGRNLILQENNIANHQKKQQNKKRIQLEEFLNITSISRNKFISNHIEDNPNAQFLVLNRKYDIDYVYTQNSQKIFQYPIRELIGNRFTFYIDIHFISSFKEFMHTLSNQRTPKL